ncbi:MAG: SDR family oxidoreductase [Bacteroidales bacterium]|nr:SDR family oxidoreductase [Bacteroidales bacterium]
MKHRTETIDYLCTDLPGGPLPGIGQILITGATGYIGGRLTPELLNRGYEVSVMVRKASPEIKDRFPGARVVVADASNFEDLCNALKGISVAYYFLHSLQLGQKQFEKADLQMAENFKRASEINGVNRIIYLTGLGREDSHLSPHLANRMKVAEILSDGAVPVTLLRAGMIIGSGSASYEILRHLVKNSRIFLIPKWAKTNGQPIGIRNVIKYLVGVLEKPETSGRSFDIGGKDVLTYVDMLRQLAFLLGKKRYYIPAGPINYTPLYGYFASLLTPVPAPITKVLIESCKYEVICQNNDILDIIPLKRLSFQEALLKAMTAEETDQVKTRWSDAYPPDYDSAVKLHELNYSPRYISSHILLSHKSPEALFDAFCQVGGTNGWFHSNWMWRLRGMFDRLIQGVGSSRGRRSADTLRINDVIDFWRVEDLVENKRLLLRAEMIMPGMAWLEFIADTEGGISRLNINAYLEPTNWKGVVYWYNFLPFHGVIFKNLIHQIERRAEG